MGTAAITSGVEVSPHTVTPLIYPLAWEKGLVLELFHLCLMQTSQTQIVQESKTVNTEGKKWEYGELNIVWDHSSSSDFLFSLLLFTFQSFPNICFMNYAQSCSCHQWERQGEVYLLHLNWNRTTIYPVWTITYWQHKLLVLSWKLTHFLLTFP